MTLNVTLPPHLEQFVREQLASGRFQFESDVIYAALHLLEEHSPPNETSGTQLKQEIDKGLSTTPSKPATKQFWHGHRERLRADDMPGGGTPARPAVRRSPRGILADLRSDISLDDIKEARSELWSSFPHGAA